MSERIASAVFDSRDEAERALSELRSAGIDSDAISIIGKSESGDGGGITEGENAAGDDRTENVVKGAVAGAAGGALLGIAALAIPGVGPLAAAGAIAAGAIPEAAAIGGGLGLAGGSLSGLLTDHGVDDDDAKYYEGRINDGGYFVSVDAERSNLPVAEAREILYRNGGHSAARQRTAAV